MFCPYCGASAPDDAFFCPRCGRGITPPDDPKLPLFDLVEREQEAQREGGSSDSAVGASGSERVAGDSAAGSGSAVSAGSPASASADATGHRADVPADQMRLGIEGPAAPVTLSGECVDDAGRPTFAMRFHDRAPKTGLAGFGAAVSRFVSNLGERMKAASEEHARKREIERRDAAADAAAEAERSCEEAAAMAGVELPMSEGEAFGLAGEAAAEAGATDDLPAESAGPASADASGSDADSVAGADSAIDSDAATSGDASTAGPEAADGKPDREPTPFEVASALAAAAAAEKAAGRGVTAPRAADPDSAVPMRRLDLPQVADDDLFSGVFNDSDARTRGLDLPDVTPHPEAVQPSVPASQGTGVLPSWSTVGRTTDVHGHTDRFPRVNADRIDPDGSAEVLDPTVQSEPKAYVAHRDRGAGRGRKVVLTLVILALVGLAGWGAWETWGRDQVNQLAEQAKPAQEEQAPAAPPQPQVDKSPGATFAELQRAYTDIGFFDKEIYQVVDDFNSWFQDPDQAKRATYAKRAKDLQAQIQEERQAFLTFCKEHDSANGPYAEQVGKIEMLFDLLDKRAGALAEAWSRSAAAESVVSNLDSILAPIAADDAAGTTSQFARLYAASQPVEIQAPAQ